MSRNLSVARILTELQARIEHHRGREAHHAEQEAFHLQQRAHHAAELQTARDRYEAFLAAADAASELVARPREKKAVDDSIPSGKRAVLSKLVARIVDGKGPLESFGAKSVTRELEERFGGRLGRKVDTRTVAAKLRRLAQAGKIHLAREGRSFHEALYTRTPGE
ncbi:MAG TPA: hypothetical protein VEW48_19595 [Thermoanaerobaculia bacterium]|nr:hypothetical protein [Thermoanaerobaculia bacterium]